MEFSHNRERESAQATGDTELILEQLAARHSFDELLATTESLCFDDTAKLELQNRVPYVRNDTLGSFACNAAMTFAVMPPEKAFQPDMQAAAVEFLRQDTTLLKYPYERAVGNKIATFGARYLTEIYSVLGEDADATVARFCDSQQTPEDDKMLLTWLLERCQSIDEYGQQLAITNEIYTPVNLSPKIIGSYPDVQSPLNCLSIDAMAIACLQRAGAEVYYTRFLKTASQDEYESVSLIAHNICASLPNMADELHSKMEGIDLDAGLTSYLHRGFHAGLIARMPSGKLYSIDPRGNMISPIEDEQYDVMCNKLEMLRGQPCDVMVDEPNGFLYDTILSRLRDMYSHSDTLSELTLQDEQVAALCDILQQPGGVERIKSKAVQYFDGVNDRMSLNTLSHEFEHGQAIDEVITKAVDRWIFHDLDEQTIQRQYIESESMQQEIAVRLRSLPVVSLMAAVVYINTHHIGTGQGKGVLPQEISNAEYGIGASVLHDMSAQLGEHLPPGFWAAHWASVVPHVELAEAYLWGDITLTDSQIEVMRTIFYWLGSVRNLHKTGYNTKIERFLAKTGPHSPQGLYGIDYRDIIKLFLANEDQPES